MAKSLELLGLTFGKLLVIARADKRKDGWHWQCRCAVCGNANFVTLGSRLVSGATKTCGCARRRHGHAGGGKRGNASKEYTAWLHMRARCGDAAHTQFVHYGARGILVCTEWQSSFDAFLRDMGESPARAHLDRIDNDGNYEPCNCRWATAKVSERNKRNTRRLTYLGVTKALIDWAEEFGIGVQTLSYRVFEANWDIGEALNTPPIDAVPRGSDGRFLRCA